MQSEPFLFISYRRTHLVQVHRIRDALERAGIRCFLDVEDIQPLADFPDRIREAIGRSHAFLAWWSADYGESDYCLQEFRLAWQHARRHTSDLVQRIWVVNPEERADHVFSGELDRNNFLKPPAAGAESLWAAALLQRFQNSNLTVEGRLADERQLMPAPTLYGLPEKSREFTGRGREEARLHSKLHPARIGDRGAAVAVQICGLGGVGKTELAIAYARDYAAAYPAGAFWLNLAGWQPTGFGQEATAELLWLRALEQAFRLEPEALQGVTKDADGKELPQEVVRERLGERLSGRGAYLWVLDNFPEISPLDERARILQFFRAPSSNGCTLLTTRDSRPIDGFGVEPLDTLSEAEALRLLAKYRPQRRQDELPAMRQLICEVGAHTQALILLGEHARNDPAGYPDVLKRLEEGIVRRIDAISGHLQELLGTKARGILATFALSIQSLGEGAKQLLALASVCAPNLPIPDLLLANLFGGERRDEFILSLGSLLRSSLLQRRAASVAEVSIHPLVAEAATNLLDVDKQRLQWRLAGSLLERVAYAIDIRTHSSILPDIEQARYLGMRLEEEQGVLLLLRVGQFEQARGRYVDARVVQSRALEVARRVLGEHETTVASMTSLAGTLRDQGKLSAARALNEQALSEGQRILGEQHPTVLSVMHNLALTLSEQGEFGTARILNEKLISMRGQLLGAHHPDTLSAMGNLAVNSHCLGELGAARHLYETVLSIKRDEVGDVDPNLLPTLGNLALTLKAQGDLKAARELHEKVLKLRQRIQGENHPDTLSAVNSLANTILLQGDARAARALHEKVQATSRRVLGEEHPSTLSSLTNLANALRTEGNPNPARVLLERVLSIRLRTCGEEHPNTMTTMHNLANAMHSQGEFRSAQLMLERVLSLRRRILGEQHPDTLISSNSLALVLEAQGDFCAAQGLLEQLLPVCRLVSGELHPQTLSVRNNLANVLKARGDLGVSRGLHEQALSDYRCQLGEEHPDTLAVANNLADTLREQGHLRAAGRLQEQTLSICRRVQGEEHPDTSIYAWNLLQTWLESGNWSGAIALLHTTLLPLLQRDPLSLSPEQRALRNQVPALDEQLRERAHTNRSMSTVWIAPLVTGRPARGAAPTCMRVTYRVKILELRNGLSLPRLHATRLSWGQLDGKRVVRVLQPQPAQKPHIELERADAFLSGRKLMRHSIPLVGLLMVLGRIRKVRRTLR